MLDDTATQDPSQDYSDVVALATGVPPTTTPKVKPPAKPRNNAEHIAKIREINPDFADTAEGFIDHAKKNGLDDVQIKSGYRSAEEQNALYRNPKTRSRTMGNDGYVKESPHQQGRAIDWTTKNPANRNKLHQLIRDYANANDLQIPHNEPWHMGGPAQDPYSDVKALARGTKKETPTPKEENPYADVEALARGDQGASKEASQTPTPLPATSPPSSQDTTTDPVVGAQRLSAAEEAKSAVPDEDVVKIATKPGGLHTPTTIAGQPGVDVPKPPPDIHTPEGRARRDEQERIARGPALAGIRGQKPVEQAEFEVQHPTGSSDWTTVDSKQFGLTAIKQFARARNIPDEYVDQWLKQNSSILGGKILVDANGKELTPTDLIGTSSYNPTSGAIRVHAYMAPFQKLTQDYAGTISGALQQVPGLEPDRTAGERLLSTEDLAQGAPRRALNAAVWSTLSSDSGDVADMEAVRRAAMDFPDAPVPESAKNPIPRVLKRGVQALPDTLPVGPLSGEGTFGRTVKPGLEKGAEFVGEQLEPSNIIDLGVGGVAEGVARKGIEEASVEAGTKALGGKELAKKFGTPTLDRTAEEMTGRTLIPRGTGELAAYEREGAQEAGFLDYTAEERAQYRREVEAEQRAGGRGPERTPAPPARPQDHDITAGLTDEERAAAHRQMEAEHGPALTRGRAYGQREGTGTSVETDLTGAKYASPVNEHGLRAVKFPDGRVAWVKPEELTPEVTNALEVSSGPTEGVQPRAAGSGVPDRDATIPSEQSSATPGAVGGTQEGTAPTDTAGRGASDTKPPVDTTPRITRALRTLPRDKAGAIRIADIHAALPDVPPEEINQTLQEKFGSDLQPIEDVRARTPADKANPIRVLGQERHLIYPKEAIESPAEPAKSSVLPGTTESGGMFVREGHDQVFVDGTRQADLLEQYPVRRQAKVRYADGSTEVIDSGRAHYKPKEAEPVHHINHMERNADGTLKDAPNKPQFPPGDPRAEPLEEGTTGPKVAITRAEREARGLDPVHRAAYMATPDSYYAGKAAVESEGADHIDPAKLADEIANNPRPLTNKEVGALAYDRAVLKNRANALYKATDDIHVGGDPIEIAKHKAKVEEVENGLDLNDQALEKGGREQSSAFAARKAIVKDDYTLATAKQRARALKGGKLTPEVEKQLSDVHARLEQVQKQLDEHIADTEKRQAESALNRVKGDVRGERKAGRAAKKADLDSELADLKSQFSSEYKKIKGVQASGFAALDPEGKLTKIIGQMAKNRVKAGLNTVEGIVDDVYEQLKDVVEGITKREIRDAFTGYGETTTMSQDALNKQLRELRALGRDISAVEDIEGGQRPLRSGLQRDQPTQAIRESRARVQAALKAHPEIEQSLRDPVAQQKSALDAMKTQTRNRIDDLNKWIKDGKRTVAGKTQVIADDELKGLQAERDRLQAAWNKTGGDQEKIDSLQRAVEKSIADYEKRIKTGDIAPRTKTPGPTSPELDAARQHRDTLQSILSDQRAAARTAAQIPKTEAEVNAARLQALKTRTEKQIADLEKQVGTKNITSPTKRSPVPLDDEAQKLKTRVDRLKIERERIIQAQKKLTPTDVFMKYARSARRAVILSGTATLSKLTAAVSERSIITPIEEAIGAVEQVLPGVRRIAKMAPREGGMNLAAERKAVGAIFSRDTPKQMWQKFRTGLSDLDIQFGEPKVAAQNKVDKVLELPGRIHGALKVPAQRNEFARSLEKRLAFAQKAGEDITDSAVINKAGIGAYTDAQRAILMNDNRATQAYTRILGMLEKNFGAGGKVAATTGRILMPIVKVPTNYFIEATSYLPGGGIAKGVGSIIAHGGIDKLTPEAADAVLRAFKKQGLGAGLFALGWYGYEDVGGFYQRGEERKDTDVKAGEVRMFGYRIPKILMDHPAFETMMFAADLRRSLEPTKGDFTSGRKPSGKLAATGSAALGMAERVPFVGEPLSISRDVYAGEKMVGEGVGQFTRDLMIPPDFSKYARVEDQRRPVSTAEKAAQWANVAPVDARRRRGDAKDFFGGFKEGFKEGIPGPYGRKSIPINEVFGTEPSKGSDEVQRLNLKIDGARPHPDETPKEFEERKKIVNPVIKKAVDDAVGRTYRFKGKEIPYDKLPEDEKSYQIKQAKKDALEDLELPEKPEKPEPEHAEPIMRPTPNPMAQTRPRFANPLAPPRGVTLRP